MYLHVLRFMNRLFFISTKISCVPCQLTLTNSEGHIHCLSPSNILIFLPFCSLCFSEMWLDSLGSKSVYGPESPAGHSHDFPVCHYLQSQPMTILFLFQFFRLRGDFPSLTEPSFFSKLNFDVCNPCVNVRRANDQKCSQFMMGRSVL